MVGFSVSNDVDFLNNACQVYKLDKITYDFVDVQLLHKTVYKKQNMCGLEGVANEFGIEYLAHRSDEDARVTLLVLKRMANELNLSIEELNDFVNEIPLGRIGSADEIAAAIEFLASDKADYITGQILGINGGFVI